MQTAGTPMGIQGSGNKDKMGIIVGNSQTIIGAGGR
jgi:hypothetical protein